MYEVRGYAFFDAEVMKINPGMIIVNSWEEAHNFMKNHLKLEHYLITLVKTNIRERID